MELRTNYCDPVDKAASIALNLAGYELTRHRVLFSQNWRSRIGKKKKMSVRREWIQRERKDKKKSLIVCLCFQRRHFQFFDLAVVMRFGPIIDGDSSVSVIRRLKWNIRKKESWRSSDDVMVAECWLWWVEKLSAVMLTRSVTFPLPFEDSLMRVRFLFVPWNRLLIGPLHYV